MSSKWTSDDEGKSDTGSRQGASSPTSEQKDGAGGSSRRSRRPRPGRTSGASEDASKGEGDRPAVKTRTGG